MTRQQTDAFSAFYAQWKEDNPQANEYLPFDLQEFFEAGLQAQRELVWHGKEDVAERGRTIMAHEPESGDTQISYGGGQIEHGYWAYADELFSEGMLYEIHEREAELASWLEQERIRQMDDMPV